MQLHFCSSSDVVVSLSLLGQNSKSDGLSSAVLYSFRRRSSTRRWILDALVVAAIGTFIGVFGYAAKVTSLLRCRRRLEVQEAGGLSDAGDGFSPVGHR